MVQSMLLLLKYYNFGLTDAYKYVNDSFQEEARVWVEHMSDGMVQIKPS